MSISSGDVTVGRTDDGHWNLEIRNRATGESLSCRLTRQHAQQIYDCLCLMRKDGYLVGSANLPQDDPTP